MSSRWLFKSGWFHFIAGETSFIAGEADMQRVDIPYVVFWGESTMNEARS